MKEQIITFETAKLAKGVGLPQLMHVNGTASNGYHANGLLWGYSSKGSDYMDENYIYAPTQALLQKWLREEHNVHVYCVLHYSGSSYIYKIQQLGHILYPNFNEEYKLQYTDSPYDTEWERLTYEDMLEQGLFRALQLIKEED